MPRRMPHAAADDGSADRAFAAWLRDHPVPAWVYRRDDLRIIAVNDAACRAYGFERARFLELDLLALRSPEEGARLLEQLRRQGPHAVHPGPARWRHRRADGSEFPVEVTASAVDWDGEPAVLVLARDLSEEERLRAEQRAWDARFEALVAHASGVIALVQETGVVSFLSDSADPILGQRPRARVGTLLEELIHPDDRGRAAALFAPGTVGPRRAPLRLAHANGVWVPMDVVVQDLRHEPAVGAFVLNAREARDAARRAQVLQALLRIYELPWDDEAGEPFAVVLEEAVATLGGTRGSALVRDRDGRFRFATAVGYDLERLRPFTLAATEALFGIDWRDGEPHLVDDVGMRVDDRDGGGLGAVTRGYGVVRSLAVPILVEGDLEAALSIDLNDPEARFPDDALPLARLFGRQAGVALARRRAEAEVRRHRDALEAANRALGDQVERLETLRRIDAAIADQTEPSAVLDVILEQLLLNARADGAAVLLQDPESAELRYAASLGLPHHLLRGVALPPGGGLAGRALAERAPIVVDGRNRLAKEHGAGAPAMLARYESYAAFPLIAKGRPLGVLEVFFVDGSARAPEHEAFVAAIAGQAAVALDVAQLLERLRTAAASYRDLANFSGRMEELHDVDALLETGASTLMVEFEMASAGYFVAKGDTLHLERAWGEIPEGILDIASAPQAVGEGAIGLAAAHRDVVYLPEYGAWEGATPGLPELGLVSMLCLPVVHEPHVHVLVLASYHRRQDLRPDQLTVARAFVRRLEHALERADYLRAIEATREEAFRALGMALEHRDYETKGHTDRVVALARRFADALGLPPERVQALQWGAYLHDLGKIAIPDRVLLKPGRLDPDEYALIRTHATIGDELCAELRFLPLETRQLVRSHHERWDGAGYPDGLAGEGIPLLARMFSLIDVYDALTSERPYKPAWSSAEARAELAAGAGSQFDPELTERFLELLAADQPGDGTGDAPNTRS